MKKIGLLIIILILFSIILFHGYSFYVKAEFENYLSKKYPDKAFEVSYPSYSLISYNEILIGDYFNTSAYCITDDTKFVMIRTRGKIDDKYFIMKNRNLLKTTVFSYLKNKQLDNYIDSIAVGAKKKANLDVKNIKDIKNSIEGISIYYNKNIKDNEELAKISYKIIKILKFEEINFDGINFTSDRKNGVYELRIKKDEINKSPNELLDMIEKRK